MSKRPYRGQLFLFLLFLAAAAGLVDSVLVHLKDIASLTDPHAFDRCAISSVFNCLSVAHSRYANLWGLPVSLIGILFYTTAASISFILLGGITLRRWQVWSISIIALIALIFSLRLLFLSYFGVGVLCLYCVLSNLTTALVVLFWFLYSSQEAHRPLENMRMPK